MNYVLLFSLLIINNFIYGMSDSPKEFEAAYLAATTINALVYSKNPLPETFPKLPEQKKNCPYCGKEFNKSSSNFNKHIRTHTGEKPYQCPNCQYATGDKSTFNRHVKIHWDKKPFKCEYCDYTTGDRSALKKHLDKNGISVTISERA